MRRGPRRAEPCIMMKFVAAKNINAIYWNTYIGNCSELGWPVQTQNRHTGESRYPGIVFALNLAGAQGFWIPASYQVRGDVPSQE